MYAPRRSARGSSLGPAAPAGGASRPRIQPVRQDLVGPGLDGRRDVRIRRPAVGGLYLKPAVLGRVVRRRQDHDPSACPVGLARLWFRIAWLMTGVGVYCDVRRPSRAARRWRPAPRGRAHGRLGQRVGVPSHMRGPVMPRVTRYSATAWQMARIWSSLKLCRIDDPRCPDVPNATRCVGSFGSGRAGCHCPSGRPSRAAPAPHRRAAQPDP
jgi:hypothetical protein